MKLKSEVHEVLLFLFLWDGMPPAVTCNNAKDLIHGELIRKPKEVSCHLQQTEPFTSWLNATEREMKIKEMY